MQVRIVPHQLVGVLAGQHRWCARKGPPLGVGICGLMILRVGEVIMGARRLPAPNKVAAGVHQVMVGGVPMQVLDVPIRQAS